MKKIILLTTLLLSMSTLGFSTKCDSDTLADYIADGGSCTVGNLSFSGFSYKGSATGGAKALSALGIKVVPWTKVAGEPGLLFTAGWSAGSGKSEDSLISYTVTALAGFALDDAVLKIAGFGKSGTGAVKVGETASNGVSLSVFDNSGLKSISSLTFKNVHSLKVAKDINVKGGRKGTAAVSAVFNLFSTAVIVPEPGSLVLFGSGLIGLASLVRRRQRKLSR